MTYKASSYLSARVWNLVANLWVIRLWQEFRSLPDQQQVRQSSVQEFYSLGKTPRPTEFTRPCQKPIKIPPPSWDKFLTRSGSKILALSSSLQKNRRKVSWIRLMHTRCLFRVRNVHPRSPTQKKHFLWNLCQIW